MAEYTTETARLLVVSQESAVLHPIWSVAEPNSWQIEVAANAWDAIERVQSGAVPHLLLLDVPRGDGNCLHILRWVRRLHPDLPVIVICSPEDAGRKKEAIQLGAHEVLVRPFDEADMESAIQRHLLASDGIEAEIASEDIEQVGPESYFVSASPVTQKLRAQAELLGEADVPVLLVGEQGSGKETVARLIHKLSVRGGFQFLKVNCASMPADLLEAELFGNERVSSSGNTRAIAGKFERANKGTIFLDELTELPVALQGRLVQLLQDNGHGKAIAETRAPADARILAASSESLDRAVAEKRLRADLYYRLSAFTVQVPSLRQRKSEISLLLRHTMHHTARRYGLTAREFSPAVLGACQQYSWPGNLRELENFVKRFLVAGDSELTFNDIGSDRSQDLRRAPEVLPRVAVSSIIQIDHSRPKSLKSLIQNVKSEAEKTAIGTALHRTGWNRKAAARLLQVSYRTLLYKIEQYQISASEPFVSPLLSVNAPLADLPARVANVQNGGNHESDWKRFPRSKS